MDTAPTETQEFSIPASNSGQLLLLLAAACCFLSIKTHNEQPPAVQSSPSTPHLPSEQAHPPKPTSNDLVIQSHLTLTFIFTDLSSQMSHPIPLPICGLLPIHAIIQAIISSAVRPALHLLIQMLLHYCGTMTIWLLSQVNSHIQTHSIPTTLSSIHRMPLAAGEIITSTAHN